MITMFFFDRPLRVLVGLLLLSISLPVYSICNWPNGVAASKTDLGECSGNIGMCCHPGDSCLSSGICAGPKDVFYRGGCTEKLGLGEGCPGFCSKENNNAITVVTPCPDIKRSAQLWICGGNVDSCNDGNADTFELNGDLTVIGAVVKAPVETGKGVPTQEPSSQPTSSQASSTQAPSTKASTAPTSSSKPSSGHPSSTEAPTSQTSSTPRASQVPQPTAEAPPPPPEPTTSPPEEQPTPPTTQQPPPRQTILPPTNSTNSTIPPQQTNNTTSSKVIPIGVGIGVGASVMIAGSILAFVFARKRHHRHLRSGPVRAETPPPLDLLPPPSPVFDRVIKPSSSGGGGSSSGGAFSSPTSNHPATAPAMTMMKGGGDGGGGGQYPKSPSPVKMMRMDANDHWRVPSPVKTMIQERNERNYTPYRPPPPPPTPVASAVDQRQGQGQCQGGMMMMMMSSSASQGRLFPVDGFTAGLPGVHRVHSTQRHGQGQGQGQWGRRMNNDGAAEANGNGVYEMA